MINFSPKELNNDNWSNKKTKQSNYRLHSKSLEIKKKNFFSQKAVFCVCVWMSKIKAILSHGFSELVWRFLSFIQLQTMKKKGEKNFFLVMVVKRFKLIIQMIIQFIRHFFFVCSGQLCFNYSIIYIVVMDFATF